MAEGTRTLGASSAADTPPPNPFPGERWVDTSSGIEYLWFPDPNNCWAEINPMQNLPPGEVLALLFPATPVVDQRYTNGSGKEWVFNGIGWAASKSIVADAGTAERPGVAIGSASTGWFSEAPNKLTASIDGTTPVRIIDDRLEVGAPEDAAFSDDIQLSFTQIAELIGTVTGESGAALAALVGRVSTLETTVSAQGTTQTAHGAAITSVQGRTTTLEGAVAANIGMTSTYYGATATITKPAAAKAAKIYLWGPGGTGGNASNQYQGGGGGGGGGYVEKYYLASALAASTVLTVASNRVQFGASLIANAGAPGSSSGSPGAGGSATGGDINRGGHSGQAGVAGTAANPAATFGGAGGDGMTDIGNGGSAKTGDGDGNNAGGHSAGGGGAVRTDNSSRDGGHSTPGFARIDWFY